MTDSLPETNPEWEICFGQIVGGHVHQIDRFRQSPSEPFLTSGIAHHLKNENQLDHKLWLVHLKNTLSGKVFICVQCTGNNADSQNEY